MTRAIHLVVIDTETGGLDPYRHCIIEIAVALIAVSGTELSDVLSCYNMRMMPDMPVTKEAAAVNGYHPDTWGGFIDRRMVFLGLLDWCREVVPEGSLWCGMNVDFDLCFLKNELLRQAKLMPPQMSYRKLDVGSLCFPLFAKGITEGTGLRHLRKWAGLKGEQSHSAVSDVQDTIAVLSAYLRSETR